jgi:hypothetical protein
MDKINVSYTLRSFESELDYTSYLVGSSTETFEYNDIDIVIITNEFSCAKEILEENKDMKRSFGQNEGISTDKWKYQDFNRTIKLRYNIT